MVIVHLPYQVFFTYFAKINIYAFFSLAIIDSFTCAKWTFKQYTQNYTHCIKSLPLLRITQTNLIFDLVVLFRNNWLDSSKTCWCEVSLSPNLQVEIVHVVVVLFHFLWCSDSSSVSKPYERTDSCSSASSKSLQSLLIVVFNFFLSPISFFFSLFFYLPRWFKSWIRNGICCILNCWVFWCSDVQMWEKGPMSRSSGLREAPNLNAEYSVDHCFGCNWLCIRSSQRKDSCHLSRR